MIFLKGLFFLMRGLGRIADAADRWVLGFFLVRGLALAASMAGEFLRLFQVGNLRGYTFFFALGAAWLLSVYI